MPQLLRSSVSLGLLAWVLWRAEWREVASRLVDARWPLLAAFALMPVVSVLISVFKWRLLLAARGARVPLGKLFGLYVLGQFYSQVLPSSVGGDVIRAAALRGAVPSRMDAFGSVVVERLTGLAALIVLAVASLTASAAIRSHTPLLVAAAVCVVGFGAALAAIVDPRPVRLVSRLAGSRPFLQRVFAKIERFRHYLDEYRKTPGVLLRCMALSGVFYVSSIATGYLAINGIGYQASVATVALALPVVLLVSNLPIAINGIGLAEWAFGVTFAALGAPPSAGVAAALVIRLRNVLWASGGYAVLASCGIHRPPVQPEPEGS